MSECDVSECDVSECDVSECDVSECDLEAPPLWQTSVKVDGQERRFLWRSPVLDSSCFTHG